MEFPVRLSFHLSCPVAECSSDKIHELLPGLQWGDESDLMKASGEWPQAVVLIEDWFECDIDMRSDFPTEVNFVHFPGRVVGNEAIMLPTKLALLRLLSSIFECRVICAAGDFHREDDDVPLYSLSETFLCQGGRVFSTPVTDSLVFEGYRAKDGWRALDELPVTALDASGQLIDSDDAVRAIAGWIRVRDQTLLKEDIFDGLIHPKLPKPIPEAEQLKPTQEEIDAEMAREFPTEEEIDEEEWEMEEHFKRLKAWERGFGTTAGKQLLEDGISLPPADQLSDKELTEKLWQVIHGLAGKNTYLHSTNHLDDRELYTWLWQDALNEEIMSAAGLSDSGAHLDVVGSGDEAAKNISLIYYDRAADRADWHASWPDDPIPAHIDPQHDRDGRLPQSDAED